MCLPASIDDARLDARLEALRVDNMRLRAMVSHLRSYYAGDAGMSLDNLDRGIFKPT